jgi:hypothetical protein
MLAALPRSAARGQPVMVQPAALRKVVIEEPLLAPGGIQALLERLTQAGLLGLKHTSCQSTGSCIPRL